MNEQPVVLITGASRGIGRATALSFARKGHRLGLTALEDKELGLVADEARDLGARVETFCGDLADLAFCESVVRLTVERLGRMDTLVNNAATHDFSDLDHIMPESWERSIRVNLTAPVFLAKHAIGYMSKIGGGVIINISSIEADFPKGFAPSYAAAKGGLRSVSYDMANFLGDRGIRVVVLSPGAVVTEMSADYKDAKGESMTKELLEWSNDMIPLRRWAQADEVALVIVWLASNEASYLTGTEIRLDGGWSHNNLLHSLKQRNNPRKHP